MTLNRKIELLKKVLDRSNELSMESYYDPDFLAWEALAKRNFIKVFGEESKEFQEFKKLSFGNGNTDSSYYVRRDVQICKDLLIESIEEFNVEQLDEPEKIYTENSTSTTELKKVFISHSSNDANIVEELIDILETIGLDSTNIFCTSFGEYGISLGENFLQRIKNELSENVLVLFLISENFYKSPVCLCEMGATWVQSQEHIPILVPPFKFEQIEGVIPLTQGLYINDSSGLNLFKERIEEMFAIADKMKFANWERKRNRILNRIGDKLK